MAIKLQAGENKFVYKAGSGILTTKAKRRADKIYADSSNVFSKLAEKNTDILETWYLRGKAANSLSRRFSINTEEKVYFWRMLYEVAGIKMPQTALTTKTKRNDFLTASLMAQYQLKDLRKVGTWSMWREFVGSVKVADDERVAKWVIGYILKHDIDTRDGARPLLRFVRNRLRDLDTSKLTKKELISKLSEFAK